MIVPVAAEMYAVCAIRYVSRQMVHVEACYSAAEGFVQRQTSYIASTTTAVFRFWCGRLGTAVTHVSSLRTFTTLAFVPLIVPFSLKSEAGVLLHP